MWTKFIKLADKNNWYDDDLCYNGPSCYELAIAGSHDESLKIVYVGETANERRRMIAYGSHGSHLSEIIDWHLERGWYLFYRAVAKNTKEEAKKCRTTYLQNLIMIGILSLIMMIREIISGIKRDLMLSS